MSIDCRKSGVELLAADLARYMFNFATRRLGAGELLLLADALLGCFGAACWGACRREEWERDLSSKLDLTD